MKDRYPLLFQAQTPAQLKKIERSSLPKLCKELRSYLLECVSQSSGHLASGLGVVELTVALHYVFDTPNDKLIWDVGHQAYPHKILTGRAEKLTTIRQKNGLHPFPFRSESEYDVLTVGHSSTSISALLGLTSGQKLQQINQKSVCVIGDGAMTAGMAFEALNHAGSLKQNMLVILNDNEMSISQNVGGLNNHFAKMLSGKTYNSLREQSKKILKKLPPIGDLVKKTEDHIKGFLSPTGAIFESFGFHYTGIIDGHNLDELIDTLEVLKTRSGPQFLHISTKKGKGYVPAEIDPISYHGVPKFDHRSENLPSNSSKTYSDVFGEWLCKKAKEDHRLIGITPAMKEGSAMVDFANRYPDRFFDVAIAEQHAVTFGAGLAISGLKPVVAIYSTFLQRAYDQVIHDVAIDNLPVIFAIDRAGIVGADGQTHQGAFDISFLRCIPNMTILTPSCGQEMEQMFDFAYQLNSPCAIRYPRGNAVFNNYSSDIKLGKANLIKQGKQVAILNFGTHLDKAKNIAEKHNFTLVDMRFVKPLDEEIISSLSKNHNLFITIEENATQGGAGSAVSEFLHKNMIFTPLASFGIPDKFIEPSTQNEAYQDIGLDEQSLEQEILTLLSKLAI